MAHKTCQIDLIAIAWVQWKCITFQSKLVKVTIIAISIAIVLLDKSDNNTLSRRIPVLISGLMPLDQNWYPTPNRMLSIT